MSGENPYLGIVSFSRLRVGKQFWNFQRQGGGNEKFSEAGEKFFRGESNVSRSGRGNSKLRDKNNFQNDIDSKVTPQISHLNIFTLFKAT